MPTGGKGDPTRHFFGMFMDSREMEWATRPSLCWKVPPGTTFRLFPSIFGGMGNLLQPMPTVGFWGSAMSRC
jgi:hypothetical protein